MGTIAGSSRVMAGTLRKRRVNIAYVQVINEKGIKLKKLGMDVKCCIPGKYKNSGSIIENFIRLLRDQQ